MMLLYFVCLILPLFTLGDDSNVGTCDRPAQLLEFEEACKTDPDVTGNTGSFLEQLQENIAVAVEQTKRLINMARKKLGIKVNEEANVEENKKCEYYQCVFRKMETLGINNFPNMTLTENWVNDHVTDAIKNATLMKVSSCFHAVAYNIAESTTNMLKQGANLKIANGDYGSMDELLEPAQNMLNACDLATKLMMCLNMDMTCSIFKYP